MEFTKNFSWFLLTIMCRNFCSQTFASGLFEGSQPPWNTLPVVLKFYTCIFTQSELFLCLWANHTNIAFIQILHIIVGELSVSSYMLTEGEKKISQNKNVRTKSCQQVLWVDNNSWCFNDIHMVNRTKRVKQMWCFLVFLVGGWLLDLLRHGKLQVNSLVSIPCLEDQEQKKSLWAPTWRGGTHVMFSGVRAITFYN